jgi:photosystem II stability/assembly factor-like uncharacterized protein
MSRSGDFNLKRGLAAEIVTHAAHACSAHNKVAAASKLFSLAIFCLLWGITTSAALAGSWHAGGPEGGNITALAISPDGKLFAGTKEGQLFRRDPATRQWSVVGDNLRPTPVQQIFVSPDPNRLFVRLLPDSASYDTVFRTSDAGRSFLPRLASAYNLALDPTNPAVLYAAIYPTSAPPPGFAIIQKSVDAGITWQQLAGSGLTLFQATVMAIDPRHPQNLYAGGNVSGGTAIFRSVDGGTTWSALPAIPFLQLIKIVVDPNTDGMIYALVLTRNVNVNLYASNDAGLSWSTVMTSVFGFKDFALDPMHSGRVFIVGAEGTFRVDGPGGSLQKLDSRASNTILVDPTTPGVVYSGLADRGVLESDDAGVTWHSVNDGLVGRVIHTVAVAPSEPAVVFGGGDLGVFKSQDKGQTWGDLVTLRSSPIPVAHIAVDPTNSDSVYAEDQVGLFHSADGGQQWTGLFEKGGITSRLSDLALDPAHPATIWLAFSGDFFDGTSGTIYKSTDGGATFKDVKPSLTHLPSFFTHLTIDPNDPSTLYSSVETWGFGPTVFRTRDGGTTWQDLSNRFPELGNGVTALAMDSRRGSSIIFAGTDGRGVLRSADHGDSWQAINNGLPTGTYLEVTALTSIGGRLFASFDDRNAAETHPGMGVFESTDGGDTWIAVQDNLGRDPVSALAAGVGRLYAATVGGGVATMELILSGRRHSSGH